MKVQFVNDNTNDYIGEAIDSPCAPAVGDMVIVRHTVTTTNPDGVSQTGGVKTRVWNHEGGALRVDVYLQDVYEH